MSGTKKAIAENLTIKQVIGANVRRLRTARGLSQTEFGGQVEAFTGKAWSAQTVSVAEAGRREYVVVDLLVLCLVFECTVGDLMAANDDQMIEVAPDAYVNGHIVGQLASGQAYGLSLVSDKELAAETLRRMASEPEGHPIISRPIDEVLGDE